MGKVGKLGRMRDSEPLLLIYFSFIYTLFGLGASHMSFAAWAQGKSLLSPAHRLEPTAAEAKADTRANPCSASKTIKLFPHISYIFIGKRDLADAHLPDMYLPDVHPRRRIPRRCAFYIFRRAPLL